MIYVTTYNAICTHCAGEDAQLNVSVWKNLVLDTEMKLDSDYYDALKGVEYEPLRVCVDTESNRALVYNKNGKELIAKGWMRA